MDAVKIRVLNKDPLFDYKEFNATTLGQELNPCAIETPKNEVEYWIKQFICYHSNVRCIHFRMIDRRPRSVIMQLIRATKEHPQPFVQSSRPDWNGGKERSSDPYEEKLFGQDHTPASFIQMAMQRLCNRTESRTRTAMQEIVNEMKKSDETLLPLQNELLELEDSIRDEQTQIKAIKSRLIKNEKIIQNLITNVISFKSEQS